MVVGHSLVVRHIMPHELCCSHIVHIGVPRVGVHAIGGWILKHILMIAHVPALMDRSQLGSDLVLPAFFELL